MTWNALFSPFLASPPLPSTTLPCRLVGDSQRLSSPYSALTSSYILLMFPLFLLYFPPLRPLPSLSYSAWTRPPDLLPLTSFSTPVPWEVPSTSAPQFPCSLEDHFNTDAPPLSAYKSSRTQGFPPACPIIPAPPVSCIPPVSPSADFFLPFCFILRNACSNLRSFSSVSSHPGCSPLPVFPLIYSQVSVAFFSEPPTESCYLSGAPSILFFFRQRKAVNAWPRLSPVSLSSSFFI